MQNCKLQIRSDFVQRQGWRFGNICRASALFYRMKTSFPYDKKRSARIALRRKGIVSLMRPAAGLRILRSRILFYRMKTSFPYDKKRSARMRTRRKGRWLPKQPRTRRENVPRHILFCRIGFFTFPTNAPLTKGRNDV